MGKEITFEQAKRYGFTFPGARAWIDKRNIAPLAQDAALITTPNSTVPAEFLAYIDPDVVEILTAPRKAREIFDEARRGDWTSSYEKWRVDEAVGKTEPYADYAHGTTANINSEWLTRQQYVFQTSITYGDYECAATSAVKIELAAEKQRSAAQVIDIDYNRFALLGVAGRNIYGILNDPNLPPAITASPTGVGGSTRWQDKTAPQIYDDCLTLFNELVKQSQGFIDRNSPLKLCLSPSMAVKLGASTDFNVSVFDMLNKYFSNLTIVNLPELSTRPSGDTAMMIASEVAGKQTGYIGYSEKIMAGRVIPDLSSFSQKYVSTTYGAIIKYPLAVSSMIGID